MPRMPMAWRRDVDCRRWGPRGGSWRGAMRSAEGMRWPRDGMPRKMAPGTGGRKAAIEKPAQAMRVERAHRRGDQVAGCPHEAHAGGSRSGRGEADAAAMPNFSETGCRSSNRGFSTDGKKISPETKTARRRPAGTHAGTTVKANSFTHACARAMGKFAISPHQHERSPREEVRRIGAAGRWPAAARWMGCHDDIGQVREVDRPAISSVRGGAARSAETGAHARISGWRPGG